nr:cytochrome c-type biogenesis protein [Limobrevibacterium gyesilva]
MLVLLALAGAALAVTPSERLADPALEARAREISKGLRCLVCQNESIDDSNADLAHDVRVKLRERLLAGDSDAQAVQFIVDRYGDFVLLQPPMRPATYVLWFGPGAVLLLAAGGMAIAFRRRHATDDAVPPPLSDAERERLDRLMRETEG